MLATYFSEIFILLFSSDLKLRIILFVFSCYYLVLSVIFITIASKVVVEEEMELSGDSTVEYLGSSMEYESDGSSVMSSSEGDSDDSDGSSGGDDGNYDNDSWKCTREDCSADKLLDRYTFSPPAVDGHSKELYPSRF